MKQENQEYEVLPHKLQGAKLQWYEMTPFLVSTVCAGPQMWGGNPVGPCKGAGLETLVHPAHLGEPLLGPASISSLQTQFDTESFQFQLYLFTATDVCLTTRKLCAWLLQKLCLIS